MASTARTTKKSSFLNNLNSITSQQLLYGVLLVAVFFVGYLLARVQSLEGSNGTNNPTGAVQVDPGEAAPAAKVDVGIGNLPPLGEEDAPVTIVEFSDMQCPFCRSFYTGAYPQIKSEYIDTGKVVMYFRHYPLSFHAAAQKSGEALECANDQNLMWEYHDLMYDKQQEIDPAGGTVEYTVDDMKAWAAELGMDAGTFNQCLDSGQYAERVTQDMADGTAAGVSGTPGFFINGTPVVGAQPFDSFKAIIDQELAQ